MELKKTIGRIFVKSKWSKIWK